jgi:hypothetical protein
LVIVTVSHKRKHFNFKQFLAVHGLDLVLEILKNSSASTVIRIHCCRFGIALGSHPPLSQNLRGDQNLPAAGRPVGRIGNPPIIAK